MSDQDDHSYEELLKESERADRRLKLGAGLIGGLLLLSVFSAVVTLANTEHETADPVQSTQPVPPHLD